MRKLIVVFLLTNCVYAYSQELFQLAPPILLYKSTFLSQQSTAISIAFNQPGAEIRYTLNGKEPTEKDKLYSGPITITGQRTQLKVKAIGHDFISSETIMAEFIKGGKSIKSISFTTPHESYAKSPQNILYDNIGGLLSYGGGSWLGYEKDTVEVFIELNKKEQVNNVLIDLLRDENSWIFLPEKITLLSYNDITKSYHVIATKMFSHEKQGIKQTVLNELSPVKPVKTSKLKLVFNTLRKIPDWHTGKGNHGWFFIDEIKVF